MKASPTKIIFSLSVAFIFSSCALGKGAKAPREKGPAETASVAMQGIEKEDLSNVEILWQATGEVPDAFILRYGVSPTLLTEEKRVEAVTIERADDPQYGPVYRYVLRGIPASRSVFVTIAAVKGDTTSEASPVFEVKAPELQKKTP